MASAAAPADFLASSMPEVFAAIDSICIQRAVASGLIPYLQQETLNYGDHFFKNQPDWLADAGNSFSASEALILLMKNVLELRRFSFGFWVCAAGRLILQGQAMGLRFEWDPSKAASNLKKHSITFQEATTVIADVLSITIPDPDHSEGEARFLDLGLSHRHRLLVVSYTERGKVIRIISARHASRSERKMYENKA